MRICAETDEACEVTGCIQAFPHECDKSCNDAFCHKKERDTKCVGAEDVQTR